LFPKGNCQGYDKVLPHPVLKLDYQCSDCKDLFCGLHIGSLFLHAWEEDPLGHELIAGIMKMGKPRCSECNRKKFIIEKKDLISLIKKFFYPTRMQYNSIYFNFINFLYEKNILKYKNHNDEEENT